MFVLPATSPVVIADFLQAYLILAVVVGASIGHFVFSAEMDVEAVLGSGESGKGMACH